MTGRTSATPAESPPALVAGRTCGSCAMCCKVFAIPELDKGVQQWCRHVARGAGCAIHPTRPSVCRQFFCHWLRDPRLGPDWRPDRAKFLLYTETGGKRIVVAPDAGSPTAWRREPYYAQLKRWAVAGASSNHQVLVFNGKRATAILPEDDLDLGIVEVGDEISYHWQNGRVQVLHTRASPDLGRAP